MARTIAKDHAEKRAQILCCAAKVFADEGYDRASMARLAAECGISKANIYHYYDSKDALLFDLLDAYLMRLRDRICIDRSALSPPDQLRAAVADLLDAYQGADNEHRVQSAGIAALPAAEQQVLKGYQRDMVRYFSDILASIAPQLARNPARLRQATMSIFGMLNWFYMWNSRADAGARQDYARVVSDLTLGGIAAL